MASVKPFFLSNFFFFVQFMAFTFAADRTTTKANTDYPMPLERTAPITEIKNEKAARAFFSEKWKTLDADEDPAHLVSEYAGVTYSYKYFSKVEALLNVWQPYVAKSDGLFSLSQVKVYLEVAGSGDTTQFLEAGWIVNGNGGKPRFYVYFWSYEFSPGCFNLDCGVFKIAKGARNRLNIPIQPLSTYGGQQYESNVTINYEVRENITVWAVYLQGSIVGYYPDSTFPGQVAASKADIGGVVNFMSNGPGTPHSGTEMGSGHFSGEGFKKAAYTGNIQIYRDDGPPVSNAQITPYMTNQKCYDAKISGGYIYYGGPGGKDTGCSNIW